MINEIEEALKTVFDPEMPLIDIWTMGLIYDVKADEETKKINILMTFTSPGCPMADMIIEMVKTTVSEKFPDFENDIEITFDPMRNPDKIKDPDLKRMFD